MGDVGLPNFMIDQDVIKKEKRKMTLKGLKYFDHETMEGGR
jgi:hypothetical protein